MSAENEEGSIEVPPSAYIGYTGSDREGRGPSLFERFLRIFSPEA